jgi:Holliday junction resolvase RusA-like endonuclease
VTKIAFSIPGEPKGKDRPRAIPRIIERDGEPVAVVSMHTPPATVTAEKAIRELFMRKFPDHQRWSGAVLIRFTAIFETPKSFNNTLQAAAKTGGLYCIKKPDKDNIEKLIADALNGIAWHDDAQVMGGGIKRYGSPARVDVVLECLDTPDMPPTPGQKRRDAQPAQSTPRQPEKPPRGNLTKANLDRFTPEVQARIRAALAREGNE